MHLHEMRFIVHALRAREIIRFVVSIVIEALRAKEALPSAPFDELRAKHLHISTFAHFTLKPYGLKKE
jgi:hypothetical protein